MEETISLKELFATLRKRVNLIIVVTILAVMISGIVSYFFLTPIYQVSTQLLVNQAKNEESAYNYNEVQTNLQLINTYNVIIKSPAILDIVKEELKLDMSTNVLNEKITVSSEQNSQVVNINVQDEDPKNALAIANKVADVFQREVANIMNVDNVKILAKAEIDENMSPIKPQPLLNIAIGLVIGLMLSIGLAFLLEYLDNTIKTEQDVEKYLNIPVLGVIPMITEKDEVHVNSNSSRIGKREVRHV
ncbi:capsular biosynthesis protein [Bacillus sp. AGMB 02131]|uniref:Capsular biosynthesis protein n=1 Tax=Peribacillus faecalis TaxID=2772559 RepID=A0A927H930_9BACI|nr:Wzz/FepE/Etk N-terminal domain-containing protein [Peribacillus faecalis]MBD3107150.1 capsular biosynthesis protein [Peribacillus faecalis]